MWRGVLLVGLLVLAGCGGGRPKLYPVSGSVTVKGKPADGAVVRLFPAAGGEHMPAGVVQPDGSFKLTTFEPGDGAPAGEYKLTVTWRPAKKTTMDPDGPDKLAGRYADAGSSRLTAKVDAGPTTLPAIALE